MVIMDTQALVDIRFLSFSWIRMSFCHFSFLCSERFLVSISKSDSTQKVNQPQKIENSTCVFTVSIYSISFKLLIVSHSFKLNYKFLYVFNIIMPVISIYHIRKIVVIAHTDWPAQRWLAKYKSPPSSRRKTKWLPVSNEVALKQVKLLFGPLVIQLMWYILKQLCTSVSVNNWIIVNYNNSFN